MKKFAEYNKFNLSDINKEVLERWNAESLFEKSMEEREGCPTFVFYEGPPSANGMPGIHHVMARTIKDIFCRYKTMKGFHVKRKAGWDTHGLPVELGVEKTLGITKEDIGKKISIEEYNKACRREVMKYTGEWKSLTNKMGYWVDTDNPYITYDNKYIESLWWLLSQLYKKGLLYKGYTIQPYSPAAGTGLSSHELNQPGCYRDVKDTTATVLFDIVDAPTELTAWGRPCFAAWTTTPWTLPSNTALCVGPRFDYVAVNTFNAYTGEKITVVMAKDCMKTYLKPEGAEADMEGYKAGDKVVPYRIVKEWKGSELVGMKYRQLMPWVKPSAKVDGNASEYVRQYASENAEKCFAVGADTFVEMEECAFRVIPGDYVTTDDGTGIVHIAPTFGADDAKVAKAADIPSLFMITNGGDTRPMVDFTGKYFLLSECASAFVGKCVNTELYTKYEGRYVKNDYAPEFNVDGKFDKAAADKAEDLNIYLSLELKQQGKALKIEKHVHNYPHCWRTDKPVLYYPLDSWFIKSTAVRDRMIELNEQILWKPASTGSGRFGKWLENLQDWNLSRSRYWGTPLPIWRTRNSGKVVEKCIDSVATLYDEIEKSVAAGVMSSNPLKEAGFVVGDNSKANYDRIDLHRPYVDDIVLVSDAGEPMYREADLIDVWFDSGAMPFAQQHYPFENKEIVDNGDVFPADFIAEGVDQTRGWFFTLHAIATMVKNTNSFKAVISNGLVLDKYGNKMSKRLGNAVNPFEIIEKYGSDPLRWYMISNSSPWDNLKFDEAGVTEVARKMFATLYNTYSFLSLYANVDGFTGDETVVPLSKRPEIDRWILSSLNTLIKTVDTSLESYEPTKAARAISDFVNDNLSNWYVRLNRKRFWGGGMSDDKLSAYQTLYECMKTISLLMAPISPFYADRLYRDLVHAEDAANSVHLAKFPVANDDAIDTSLEERMAIAQTLTSMVLSLRRKSNIKVRQPLSTIMIPVDDPNQRAAIEAMSDLILSEVNVKAIKYVKADDGILVYKVKPDFKKLGPKHGKNMKAVAGAIAGLSQAEILEFQSKGALDMTVNGESVRIDLEDVEIFSEDIPGWLVANEGSLTLALDVTISDELRQEGIARDIVNRIQNLRKSRDYDITDRIKLAVEGDAHTNDAVLAFSDYIKRQVLADSIEIVAGLQAAEDEVFDIDGLIVKVGVELSK
ncbi:MAG: isoleucine--tRNA ligase [Bacteroidales bacterium]|nr:isoleucine--tRNA ligase [Bacteroidales bacterium]